MLIPQRFGFGNEIVVRSNRAARPTTCYFERVPSRISNFHLSIVGKQAMTRGQEMHTGTDVPKEGEAQGGVTNRRRLQPRGSRLQGKRRDHRINGQRSRLHKYPTFQGRRGSPEGHRNDFVSLNGLALKRRDQRRSLMGAQGQPIGVANGNKVVEGPQAPTRGTRGIRGGDNFSRSLRKDPRRDKFIRLQIPVTANPAAVPPTAKGSKGVGRQVSIEPRHANLKGAIDGLEHKVLHARAFHMDPNKTVGLSSLDVSVDQPNAMPRQHSHTSRQARDRNDCRPPHGGPSRKFKLSRRRVDASLVKSVLLQAHQRGTGTLQPGARTRPTSRVDRGEHR